MNAKKIYESAVISLLSGLTTKEGKEIKTQDEQGIDITVEKTPKQIIIRRYYSNGQLELRRVFNLQSQKLKSTIYFNTGRIHFTANYKNGVLDGKMTRWAWYGEKELERVYKDGIRQLAIHYYDQWIVRLEYDKNGKLIKRKEIPRKKGKL